MGLQNRCGPCTLRFLSTVIIFCIIPALAPRSSADDILRQMAASSNHDSSPPIIGIREDHTLSHHAPKISAHFNKHPSFSEGRDLLNNVAEYSSEKTPREFTRKANVNPEPKRWPNQFHAQLFQNRSDHLALVDLWYDWPGGRNLNLIHSQLGSSLWDVEWTNGTSFYFNRETATCKKVAFPVGILSPDWLRGATFVGIEQVNADFECYVWTKADFITYYEDIKTGLPIRWRFHSSPFQMEVLSFTVNQTLSDERWQAPSTCFESNDSI